MCLKSSSDLNMKWHIWCFSLLFCVVTRKFQKPNIWVTASNTYFVNSKKNYYILYSKLHNQPSSSGVHISSIRNGLLFLNPQSSLCSELPKTVTKCYLSINGNSFSSSSSGDFLPLNFRLLALSLLRLQLLSVLAKTSVIKSLVSIGVPGSLWLQCKLLSYSSHF